MTQDFPALGLILLFPALGVVFNLFWGWRAGRGVVNFIAPAMIFLSFGVASWGLIELLSLPAGAALQFTLWRWIVAGSFHTEIALRFDALTAVMVLVVSGVGAFIHVYSVGYMAHDSDYARFFTYMNLFELAMLVLVLADNLLLMFIGWEGVGLCSYLLIAFWYSNPEFAYNGRKAFVVTRIGDAGFLLGILTIATTLASHGVWTLSFVGMREHAELLQPVAVVAGLLLFMGATGKSAQIPLYVWLPDAMVGPTPVSALIHAATMVTAGVYMIARLNFLYMLGPEAMHVVAVIGTATAFFAATVAIVQTDIKRVLAYSTISQIGYMMLAVGVGSFAAGIFHLMAHAFFKSLLFLCAGSVIHALEGEQDMFKMGGLRRWLPTTWAAMVIASLAISGIPPFAGYFSKDMVLESAYVSGNTGLWLVGLITAGMTSFYMFRLIFLTFHGHVRVAPDKAPHIHESPPVMTTPLIVLAVFSTIGGFVGLPDGLLWGNAIGRFLEPVVGSATAARPVGMPGTEVGPMLSLIAVIVALSGILVAWLLYIRSPEIPARVAENARALYRILTRKYYVDEIYNFIVTRPLFWGSSEVLHRGVDSFVIDGIVDGTGFTVEESGEGLRKVESGNVQHYALAYLVGALIIAAYYIYLVMR